MQYAVEATLEQMTSAESGALIAARSATNAFPVGNMDELSPGKAQAPTGSNRAGSSAWASWFSSMSPSEQADAIRPFLPGGCPGCLYKCVLANTRSTSIYLYMRVTITAFVPTIYMHMLHYAYMQSARDHDAKYSRAQYYCLCIHMHIYVYVTTMAIVILVVLKCPSYIYRTSRESHATRLHLIWPCSGDAGARRHLAHQLCPPAPIERPAAAVHGPVRIRVCTCLGSMRMCGGLAAN